MGGGQQGAEPRPQDHDRQVALRRRALVVVDAKLRRLVDERRRGLGGVVPRDHRERRFTQEVVFALQAAHHLDGAGAFVGDVPR